MHRFVYIRPPIWKDKFDVTGLIGGSTLVLAYAILIWEGASMIDPVQIPILLKAIDFVFEEGRKILEERRERRKLNDTTPKSEIPEPEKEIAPVTIQEKDEIKHDLLASRIDEKIWETHEWEIGSLVRRLESQTKTYYILKEQYAKWGSALVPPVIVLEMDEKEKSMIETIKQLEIVLSKVYKKDIHPIK